MKYAHALINDCFNLVALFARAWIEISQSPKNLSHHFVALFARAWIEISPTGVYTITEDYVALFARAWIEI